jgi:hypothetical protein
VNHGRVNAALARVSEIHQYFQSTCVVFVTFPEGRLPREGFPVFVAEGSEAAKWWNWKVVFYDE